MLLGGHGTQKLVNPYLVYALLTNNLQYSHDVMVWPWVYIFTPGHTQNASPFICLVYLTYSVNFTVNNKRDQNTRWVLGQNWTELTKLTYLDTQEKVHIVLSLHFPEAFASHQANNIILKQKH